MNAHPSFDGRTALQAAAAGGHHIALNMLLRAGADLNAPPTELGGCTALQGAVDGKHLATIETLLKAGADVNAPGVLWGDTTFVIAVSGGHHAVIDMLLEADPVVRETSPWQWAKLKKRYLGRWGYPRLVYTLIRGRCRFAHHLSEEFAN